MPDVPIRNQATDREARTGAERRKRTDSRFASVALIVLTLSPVGIVAAAQTPSTPEWQTEAGGKMAFDVASVRPSKGAFTPPGFPLDSGDSFITMRTKEPPRGRFSADFPLLTYITFAYKLSLTRDQREALLAHLPKWVGEDRFTIQARAEGDPTKDQMRLMMQSLLAERFQLAVHFESRDTAVLALTLVKPGKTGAKLRPHAEGPPCDAPAPDPGRDGGIFPPVCGVYGMRVTQSSTALAGSRNTTMERLAEAIPSFGAIDRPVVDRTGLNGRFDFTMEWTAESSSATPPEPNARPAAEGPTFLEALREQLGLKLESARAPVQVLIVDHVERPSEN